MDFREAERRYAELKQQLDAGTITDEDFDAQLRETMVRDAADRWWTKSRSTGEWHYHDGSAWVRSNPPNHQERPPTLVDDGALSPRRKAFNVILALTILLGIPLLGGILLGSGEAAGRIFAELVIVIVLVWIWWGITRAIFRRARDRWWVALIAWVMGILSWLIFKIIAVISGIAAAT